MKLKTILFAAIALFLLIGVTSCERDEPTLPPAKAILGKWEVISVGGGPNYSPFRFREFYESGKTVRYGFPVRDQSIRLECEYSFINDSILLIGDIKCICLFYENKMELTPLDKKGFCFYDTEVYQRVKDPLKK